MKRFDKMITKALSGKLGKGAEITPEQLAKINKYTKADIPEEELYVRKMVLAHNAIDRDNERFSEKLLDDFARTLPGKSLLIGHQWGPPGSGRFFDSETKEISLEEAKELTGEDLVLPEGIDRVKYLEASFYTIKTPAKEELLKDIDGGIVNDVSIGFNAAARTRVFDEDSDETQYHEYKSPGEALEGSLVWLGAQPGAGITKAAEKAPFDIEDVSKTTKKKEDKKAMKTILKALGIDSEAGDSGEALQAIHALKQSATRLKALEPVVELLGEDNITEDYVKELKANAEDGKAYRKDLVEKQIKAERLLKRLDDTDEAVKARKEQLAKRDVKEIKDELVHLDALVVEKCPGESILGGGDLKDNRNNKGAGGDDELDFRKNK